VVSAVDEEANEVDGDADEAFNGITDDLAGAVAVKVLVAVGIDEQVREGGIKLKPQFTCPPEVTCTYTHRNGEDVDEQPHILRVLGS
jgi:hypothetical protein